MDSSVQTALIGLIAAGLGSILTLFGTALRERWKYRHEDTRAERDALIELYKDQIVRIEARHQRDHDVWQAEMTRQKERHDRERDVLRTEIENWRQRAWDGLTKRSRTTEVASEAADALETLVATNSQPSG